MLLLAVRSLAVVWAARLSGAYFLLVSLCCRGEWERRVLIGCLLVSPPEDPETRDVIERLASFVAEGGPQVEKLAREKNRNNPAFWWVEVIMEKTLQLLNSLQLGKKDA